VLLNQPVERVSRIGNEIDIENYEYWPILDGRLDPSEIRIQRAQCDRLKVADFELLSPIGDATIDVYIEQISASLASLWPAYSRYFREECETLRRLTMFANDLISQYRSVRDREQSITTLKQRNSIVSALVELSAALSYSVTQGTSGSSPILASRSPFPHHSLLGVGGAIRAITKFTRYLEKAFSARSAANVIANQYASKNGVIPHRIAFYESGTDYVFPLPNGQSEEFDTGGSFRDEDTVPLLTHYSLRHGFKETKFSVTAASEALTSECVPAWTLMTLSHEIMHSRVRDIFQALFGVTWEVDADLSWNKIFLSFKPWYEGTTGSQESTIETGLRNAILHFCLAIERSSPLGQQTDADLLVLTREDVITAYLRHKRLAVELFVHYHDFFYCYSRQTRLYVMSLWASWTTVAAPMYRPMEYLVRTMVTLTSGSGAAPQVAFDAASAEVLDALSALEMAGVTSPLFKEARNVLQTPASRDEAFSIFKPAYYLLDQVRRFFTSGIVAKELDRLESDPFADGTTSSFDYSASIYVHGENSKSISPMSYSLAALVKQLQADPPLDDVQWLTAWHSLVIAS
jgi:hypothetical protein